MRGGRSEGAKNPRDSLRVREAHKTIRPEGKLQRPGRESWGQLTRSKKKENPRVANHCHSGVLLNYLGSKFL